MLTSSNTASATLVLPGCCNLLDSFKGEQDGFSLQSKFSSFTKNEMFIVVQNADYMHRKLFFSEGLTAIAIANMEENP